ncbi:MAG: hypothetical protein WD646_04985 [Actinomycetota bacterium]
MKPPVARAELLDPLVLAFSDDVKPDREELPEGPLEPSPQR